MCIRDRICGNKKPTQAKIKLIFNEKEILSSSAGEGPIDAIFKSIKKIIKHNAQLTLYQVNAITKGVDAQAEVNVRPNIDFCLCIYTFSDRINLIQSKLSIVLDNFFN